jgi:hypothetical protein
VSKYPGKDDPLILPGDTLHVWISQFGPGQYGIEYETATGETGGSLIGARESAAHLAAAINTTIRERTRTQEFSWLR